MTGLQRTRDKHPSTVGALKASAGTILLACLASGVCGPALAGSDDNGAPAFAAGMIAHMQAMRQFKDPDQGAQQAPPVIPRFDLDGDPTGAVATFQPGGATFTFNNAFFQNLGTNGRTCFSCHQPQTGWTVSAASVAARFAQSGGTDPIFRLVDGATCPSDDVSTLAAKRRAYSLLIDKGLIRIGLSMPGPSILQFKVTQVDDPYGCNTSSVTGLANPTNPTFSVYRRPLPSTNLGFLNFGPGSATAFMWDGREPSLTNQAKDATLGHAQANPVPGPTDAQLAEIVAFESGIFTAQEIDREAGSLHDAGATGGAVALSLQLSKFFPGINDPLGHNPTGATFDPNIFDLYMPWLGSRGYGDDVARRLSVARGEEVFNTTPITITGVGGLNDPLKNDALNKPIAGFCGTCHDSPNVGNHSVKLPLDIGVADAGANAPPGLDISGLPVFTLTCTSGPLAGNVYRVTDPGKALISGQCADIGKVKGPILRGLASRAPYFHNGSAATLMDVVNFYEQRFGINFTDQQKTDLVNFLNSL
jgi:cytochrome c peroxidase